jgi:HAD superfamily hydrolase (TIGR01490 family)
MERVNMMEPARIGAFFDVDNTLVPGSLPIELHFFRHLWKLGRVGLKDALESLSFLLRQMPPVSFHPLRANKLYLERLQPSVIEPLAEMFVTRTVWPRVSQEALRAMERHRTAGHHLVLVTASLDFLITPLAGHLKVETVLAARPERSSNGYTGRVLPPVPYGQGKAELIQQLAALHGLDLRYSYAYGDSPGDIHSLRSVGNPLVVNPIRGMSRIAKQEGWPIERWQ